MGVHYKEQNIGTIDSLEEKDTLARITKLVRAIVFLVPTKHFLLNGYRLVAIQGCSHKNLGQSGARLHAAPCAFGIFSLKLFHPTKQESFDVIRHATPVQLGCGFQHFRT
jgi:hypothetical protein